MACGQYSSIINVWNVDCETPIFAVDIGKKPTSLSWSYEGKLLAIHCDDKKIRLIDPRSNSIVQDNPGHLGPKKPKLTFLGANKNFLCSAGFGKSNRREVALWDLRNMEKRV